MTQLIAAGDLKGKLGSTHLLYGNGALPARRVLVTGLGKEADFSRQRGAQGRPRPRPSGCARWASRRSRSVVHGAGRGGLSVADAAEALAEGSLLGAYKFTSYKRDGDDKSTPEIAEMTVLEADAEQAGRRRAQACTVGQAVGENANWARDQVNEPANYLTPARTGPPGPRAS